MPGAEKALPVSNLNDGKSRFSWRIRHASNQQKVRIWPWFTPKKKNYYIRSWNVYENKENVDIMPVEMSDICVATTRIWQNRADSEGRFVSNGALVAAFTHEITPKPNSLVPHAQ